MSNSVNIKTPREWDDVKKQIRWTFWSILLMNWILIGIGVALFVAAIFSAIYLKRWDITSVLSLTGFGDIFTVFKFSMNRVQRCLGDQVQVYTAANGQEKQIEFVEKMESNADLKIDEIKKINEEIRRATLYSMELIQDFTKIAEPLKKKPWIRALPIRYSKLRIDGKEMDKKEFPVYVGKPIKLSGTLHNESDEDIKINTVVIAIRPPFGTPDGGPFRFDFKIEDINRTLEPGEKYTIEATKRIEESAKRPGVIEDIPDKLLGQDWYAFMTCQTKDGCWHDDHNKYWFELKKT